MAPKQTRTPAADVPSMKVVARRLAALTAADMPWVSTDLDLTPPDGGPEASGPPVYRAPKRRRRDPEK
jgi:hypothetical protein